MNYNAIHVISFASGADSLGVSVGVLGPKDGHCFFVFFKEDWELKCNQRQLSKSFVAYSLLHSTQWKPFPPSLSPR